MASRIRQNYKEDCEALVNKQINLELHASYVYMSMAYYFDRGDVAYSGFSSYFKKNSDEEREHGEKFIKYQNKRGGKLSGRAGRRHQGDLRVDYEAQTCWSWTWIPHDRQRDRFLNSSK